MPSNNLIGRTRHFFYELASTNSYCRMLLEEKALPPEGTVVQTEYQHAGRGQAGNTWESEAGQNLMFSIILYPSFLAATEQFYLNMAVSLAIHGVLQNFLPGVSIKWPNDIYAEDKKLGGILIENSLVGSRINSSIVGIGLNVNQEKFSLSSAVSLKILTGHEFDIDEIFWMFCTAFDSRYAQLQQRHFTELMEGYTGHLLGLGQQRHFIVNDRQVGGTIQGVDDLGRLRVHHAEGVQLYNFKEIGFVIPQQP